MIGGDRNGSAASFPTTDDPDPSRERNGSSFRRSCGGLLLAARHGQRRRCLLAGMLVIVAIVMVIVMGISLAPQQSNTPTTSSSLSSSSSSSSSLIDGFDTNDEVDDDDYHDSIDDDNENENENENNSTTLPGVSISRTKTGRYELLEVVPHDSNAFTQGLEVLSLSKMELLGNATAVADAVDVDVASSSSSSSFASSSVGSSWLDSVADSGNGASATAVLERALSGGASVVIESTGLYGASTLRVVEASTGAVLHEFVLEGHLFAEGCTLYWDRVPANQNNANANESSSTALLLRIVQLTWRSGKGFVYELELSGVDSDSDSGSDSDENSIPPGDAAGDGDPIPSWKFSRVGDFAIRTTSGQGWGIAHLPLRKQTDRPQNTIVNNNNDNNNDNNDNNDNNSNRNGNGNGNHQFVVSDGTENLHFWELVEDTTTSTAGDSHGTFGFRSVETVAVRKRRVAEGFGDDYFYGLDDANDNLNFDGNFNGNGDAEDDPNDRWTETVRDLNELEWDPYSYGGNTILANVWYSNEILRIWVGTEATNTQEEEDGSGSGSNNKNKNKNKNVGRVTHVYDLSELADRALLAGGGFLRRGAVLNGIAAVYDASASGNGDGKRSANANANSNGEFWVTGKYWPEMYRIRLIDDENENDS